MVLDQDNNFYLISLSILIFCLLNTVSVDIIERSYMLITSESKRVKFCCRKLYKNDLFIGTQSSINVAIWNLVLVIF